MTDTMGADSVALNGPDVAARNSLTRKASLTAVTSLLDYAAKMAVGLVVTPLLVTALGRSLFGTWEILSRLVNYAAASDGRPTEALRLMIASHQGAADAGLQRRHVGSAVVVWLVFVPLVVGVGALLTWLAPVVVKASPADYGIVRLACAFLVVSMLVAGIATIPESALRGMNLGYKRMGLQTGLNLVAGILMVGAVTAGLGLAGLAAAQLALVALTGVVFLALARRHVTWFGVARPGAHEVRALLGISTWLVLADVVAKLVLASDVIILGLIMSPAVVTTYVLTGYAARTAVGILSFTVAAAMPGLGGLMGRGELARAAQLRREIHAGTWLLSTVIGGTILCWNHAFVTLWVGPENDGGRWVNLLIVLLAAQTAFIRADSYIIDAALRPRPRVLVGAVAAVATIGLAAAGTRWLGLSGLCLGVLAGRVIQSTAYPVLARRCLALDGASRTDRRGSVIRPSVVTVIVFGTGALIGNQVVAGNWAAWAAGVVATALGLGIVAFALGLPPAIRQSLRARLLSLKPTGT